MNHTIHRFFILMAPLLTAITLVAAPSRAQAEIRVTGILGVQGISGNNLRSTTFVARAEGTLSLAPWFRGGAYVQSLAGGDGGRAGFGAGALFAIRPSFPLLPFDPYGYASLGFQRAPTGAVYSSGFSTELGFGITIRLSRLFDMEIRGGYVGLFSGEPLNGYSAGLGLAIKL
jgi:hypothetical protein